MMTGRERESHQKPEKKHNDRIAEIVLHQRIGEEAGCRS